MLFNGLAQVVDYIYQCCAIIFRFSFKGESLPFFRETEYTIE
ncbi:hypothetical protein GCM10011391_31240 [Pullulanibacillus camelliae]|uniref:Uncharacterized protein n=1 Tax=Pullulanibacillus camelliae TaxID=1707096 RepID=A0A8J2YKL5_9BACL|nr:RAxF-45 family protein [Pullulanibacillus camelliae]GGE50232.1 hypothetical protein GCM10011391_31240 [Pullulanibacillus camelliae]